MVGPILTEVRTSRPNRLLKKPIRRSWFWVPRGGRVICSTKSHSRGS
jgi:hypothetical protein